MRRLILMKYLVGIILIDESLFYIDKAIDMEPNNERLINNKKIIKRYKENNNSI